MKLSCYLCGIYHKYGIFRYFPQKTGYAALRRTGAAAAAGARRRAGEDQDGALLETRPGRGGPLDRRCRGAGRPRGGAHLVGRGRGDDREDHPPHRGARGARQIHERFGVAVDPARGGRGAHGGGARLVRPLRTRRHGGHALRGDGRGRERRGQDHHDRQARRAAHQGGPQGLDRRRRHLPRRGHRPVAGVGRPRRSDDDPPADGVRPRIGGVRHAHLGQGQRRRRGAHRHRGAAAQQDQPDERADEDPQRHVEGDPRSAARGDARARRLHRDRTPSSRRVSSRRPRRSPRSRSPSSTARPKAAS